MSSTQTRPRRAVWLLIPPFLVLLAGFWLYGGLGRKPLHADPNAIPSAMHAVPDPRWRSASATAQTGLREAMAQQNLPGISVAVAAGGEVVWAEGLGWAELESRTPVVPDTRFRIASGSALLTKAAAEALAAKGRLRLDDDIRTYVPQLPKAYPAATIRQLLDGMGEPVADVNGPLSRHRCERALDALAYLPAGADGAPLDPVAKGILVSAVMEAASGQPLAALIQQQVSQPLGMRNTGVQSAKEENPDRLGEEEEDPPPMVFLRQVVLKPLGVPGRDNPEEKAGIATVYTPGFGPNPVAHYGVHTIAPRNQSCFAGSTGFFSTASDLVRLGMAMLREEDKADGSVLADRMVSLHLVRQSGIAVAVLANGEQADAAALARTIAGTFANASAASPKPQP